MKAFHQAPLTGRTFPSTHKSCVSFFRSVLPYRYSSCFSHPHQLSVSKDTNNKYTRLIMVNGRSEFSSSLVSACKDSSSEPLKNNTVMDAEQEVPIEDMDPRFIESIVFDKHLYKYEILDRKNCIVKTTKQKGLLSGNEDEMLCALSKVEQDILQGKFEWKDGQDVHTNIMEALVNLVGEQAKELTALNKSDRCLFVLKAWCIDFIKSIACRIKQIQAALVLLAIRNKGLVVSGKQNTEDNTLLESVILPIAKELGSTDISLFSRRLNNSSSWPYFDHLNIDYFGSRINFVIPQILKDLVKTFVSWRNLPSLVANDEAVMYDTFLKKFRQNRRTIYGSLALHNCLNTSRERIPDCFDLEDAKFYLFSGAENVLEMLDMCIKFAEGVTFKESPPPRGRSDSDAISLAGFLSSNGLCLKTSYGVVSRCLQKQVQPGELTPQELQWLGFPCDSLEEIREARRLLLGKQMALLDNQDSLAELLSLCGELEVDPGSIC